MPRRPRVYVPGASLHVRQRGNNRCAIFMDDYDFEVFLAILRIAARRHAVAVHGYSLMTTHTHLLLTPEHEQAVPKAMQQLGVRYVMYFNRKYLRVGTLWTGRYLAKLIDNERYWLTCLRYIEQNPVRAQIVSQPDDYRWSSYGVHALGQDSDWLTPHSALDALGANPAQRQAAYRAICGAPVSDEQVVRQQIDDGGLTRVRPGSDPLSGEGSALSGESSALQR